MRTKQIYYAQDDVLSFINEQAKVKVLSKSEVINRIIKESWDFKRKGSNGRLQQTQHKKASR